MHTPEVDSLCKDAGIKYSFENSELGFKFIIYRPKFQSDIQNVTSDVTLNVTLNATEVAVLETLELEEYEKEPIEN